MDCVQIDGFKCEWCHRFLGHDELGGKDAKGNHICCYCVEENE